MDKQLKKQKISYDQVTKKLNQWYIFIKNDQVESALAKFAYPKRIVIPTLIQYCCKSSRLRITL